MIGIDERFGLSTIDGDQMSLKSVKAKGLVKGLLFEMTVTQNYKNETNHNLEIVYTFPLSWGATFMDLSVEMGGKRLSGIVTEKKEATRRYEKAINDGDAPIMLEKNSEGLYTVNLGNLKAGEEAHIEYTYSQLLKYEEGAIRLTIPTTIAPRYGNSEGGGIKEHQTTQNSMFVEYPFSLSIALGGGIEVATIECPSHQVQVSNKVDHLSVELLRGAYLDRDFILNLSNLENQSFCIVTPDRNIGPEGCTVLASFCPPIPKTQSTKPINLKILVDCSGSMEGDSIESAKRAIHHVLSHLESKDRFSYSCYGTDVKHLIKEMKSANKFNTIAASFLIGKTKADMGGTETGGALLSTFNLGNGECQSDVLIITDGEIWETEKVIQEANDSGHRVFAIGVGSAPAESFLQELAEKSGGACELVAPNENLEQAIVRMFNRIRLPKIKNVSINWGSSDEPLWVSGNIDTIFHGNTSHIFAGFDHPIRTAPSLSFEIEDQSEKANVSSNQLNRSEDFNLARLGATKRLKDLIRDKEKTELALRYQLVTENTNCLLIHVRLEEEKPLDLPELQKIAQMQAAGWGGASSIREMHSDKMVMNISSYQSFSPISAVSVTPLLTRRSPTASIVNANISNPRVSHVEKMSSALPPQEEIKIEIKIFTPIELIGLASDTIEQMGHVRVFIKIIKSDIFKKSLPKELLEIIEILSKKHDIEKVWITILAWLLLRLEDNTEWSTYTKIFIEKLTETLDSSDLSIDIQMLDRKFFNLSKNDWF
ncbi:VIT domain-containing protein [Polynucleobacter kasalickyi]|uniref:Ca-activated chloride channel family protein n=1 Tax=Polynucleobacter kasalickyi TaxID=1938817 RepID=A0A1W2CF32_9BURK|nr:VIT domain-containing protein [Polynucleobacter kasalickyi]SMC83800.1 Ca-activated chloride channel family protein [Polynucleobacter kasalickyi]